jgi:ribosomal protein L10
LFFNDDKYEPLSILGKFNRKKSLTGKFNGGIYDNSFIDPLTLEKWSKLPSKEFMISNLCYFLNFNLNRLTGVLENLKKD